MTDPSSAMDRSFEIDRQRIMQMIPHRDPFLMIDKLTDLVADEQATGIKFVSPDEYYFKGHFPSRPVMPGVVIVEAMAQTAAVLVVHTLGAAAEGKLVYFMSIDNAVNRDFLKRYTAHYADAHVPRLGPNAVMLPHGENTYAGIRLSAQF